MSELTDNYAVYNPLDKPVEKLPIIFGFNNGGQPGLLHATLLAEDGAGLGGHACSCEGFMYGDLGILKDTRPDRHEGFREHYPDGYRMDFVPYSDVKKHEKLQAAFILNQELAEQAPPCQP